MIYVKKPPIKHPRDLTYIKVIGFIDCQVKFTKYEE